MLHRRHHYWIEACADADLNALRTLRDRGARFVPSNARTWDLSQQHERKVALILASGGDVRLPNLRDWMTMKRPSLRRPVVPTCRAAWA